MLEGLEQNYEYSSILEMNTACLSSSLHIAEPLKRWRVNIILQYLMNELNTGVNFVPALYLYIVDDFIIHVLITFASGFLSNYSLC